MDLPINKVRPKIVKILEGISDTAIFIGETGSGKSTQIPQMCVAAGLTKNDQMVCVSQPRRVAAQSLAARVAQEMGTEIGKMVGYKFRFEDHVGPETKIAYMTDGILLREVLHDATLKKYSTIIIDEVHERTLNTDILLFVLRVAQKQRAYLAGKNDIQPLRLVLMSATMDARKFSEYFNNAPMYYVKGRTFQVELFHAEQLSASDNDYFYNAISTVFKLHESEPIENGFLVFLTGQEEIDLACRTVQRSYNLSLAKGKQKITAISLYASLASKVQEKAFEPPPTNTRKVVFATNIAETSVTIPGITVVIDSGKVKQRIYNGQSRIDVLKVVDISKAQAIQRAGRAGRQSNGKCYRLYSQADYAKFPEEQTPELLRSNLSAVLLELVAMGMKRRILKVLDPPSTQLIDDATQELVAHGALQIDKVKRKEQLSLTQLGNILSAFPVDPAHAKILYAANEYDCLSEALTIVAFLSSEPVFQASNIDLFCRPKDDEEDSFFSRSSDQDSNNQFYATEGDHIRLLKIYKSYKEQKKQKKGLKTEELLKEWCKKHNLNKNRLDTVFKTRTQLQDICRDKKMNVKSSCADIFVSLQKSICHGLFLNACIFDSSSNSYKLERQRHVQVKIHPSSCLAKSQMRAFVFSELVQTTEVFARDICLIDESWLSECKKIASPTKLVERKKPSLVNYSDSDSPTDNSSASSSFNLNY